MYLRIVPSACAGNKIFRMNGNGMSRRALGVWLVFFGGLQILCAQQQMQKLAYRMEVDFHADGHEFTGYQKLNYTNASPDTLSRLFYHLFYNAFQHGSQMESRANHIRDQDGGIITKFQHLTPEESGSQQIDSIKIDGKKVRFDVQGTMLIIVPATPVAPDANLVIETWFRARVPKIIVRSGRDNEEGVAFTMTQWYPKMAMYDRSGWHPEEYIRREFFGPFADFDVRIRIDSVYTLAATGVLQNPADCGHGYADTISSNRKAITEWHFQANRVHDFAWAADSAFTHMRWNLRPGLQMHCFYKPATATVEDWKNMPADLDSLFGWMENKVGPYPYPSYSLVQGGSGGTEYPMLSMIYGKRPVNKGLIKGYPVIQLAIHEVMHNWWYAAVANDETRNAWLDEGFALFFQYEYSDLLQQTRGNSKSIVKTYDYLTGPMRINALEPMTTPSEYYDANWSYDASAYHKSAVFLNQLRYITGEEAFWRGMKLYYGRWTYGHPDGDDFILCMEQASGMQLKWYLDLWTKTNKNIDYAIGKVQQENSVTTILLNNKDLMPMPVDIRIHLKDKSVHDYTIPTTAMYGYKNGNFTVMKPWSWTSPFYEMRVAFKMENITEIEIDPDKCLMDIHPENNRWKPAVRLNP